MINVKLEVRPKGIIAKTDLTDKLSSYHVIRDGNSYLNKRNRGKDKDQYPDIIELKYLEDWFSMNNIEQVVLSNDIDKIYLLEVSNARSRFKTMGSHMMDVFSGHDYPDLYRINLVLMDNDVIYVSDIIESSKLLFSWYYDGIVYANVDKKELKILTKEMNRIGHYK